MSEATQVIETPKAPMPLAKVPDQELSALLASGGPVATFADAGESGGSQENGLPPSGVQVDAPDNTADASAKQEPASTGEGEQGPVGYQLVEGKPKLDLQKLIEAGAVVEVDGGEHKIENVLYRWQKYQKDMQELANKEKEFDSKAGELTGKAEQYDQITQRLRDDKIGVALAALFADEAHGDLARAVYDLALQHGYDPRDAKIKQVEKKEQTEKQEQTQEQQQKAAKAVDDKWRANVSARAGFELKDDQWSRVKAHIPLVKLENPNVEDLGELFAKALEKAYPKPSVPNVKPPARSDRPAVNAAPKHPIKALKDNELDKLLAQLPV